MLMEAHCITIQVFRVILFDDSPCCVPNTTWTILERLSQSMAGAVLQAGPRHLRKVVRKLMNMSKMK